jgi:hypothetical protein
MAELSLIGFGEARLLKIGSSDAAATTDLALQHGGHVASVTACFFRLSSSRAAYAPARTHSSRHCRLYVRQINTAEAGNLCFRNARHLQSVLPRRDGRRCLAEKEQNSPEHPRLPR